MGKVSTNITIDEDVKKRAQELLADLGLDLSTAVNIYLKRMLLERGIPFDVSLNVPNEETAKAIEEGRKIARDPNVKGYGSVEEMRKALGL